VAEVASESEHTCAACAARDQTIVVMADQIDWLRNQLERRQAAPAVSPTSMIDAGPALWGQSTEPEDHFAAFEAGQISEEELEQRLAAAQTGLPHGEK